MKPIAVPFTCLATGGMGTVLGHPTGVPGLVVNKAVTDCGEDTCYVVTHVRTGAFLHYCWTDPEAALGYALAITSCADWTADKDGLGTQVDIAQVKNIGRRLGGRHHPTMSGEWLTGGGDPE